MGEDRFWSSEQIQGAQDTLEHGLDYLKGLLDEQERHKDDRAPGTREALRRTTDALDVGRSYQRKPRHIPKVYETTSLRTCLFWVLAIYSAETAANTADSAAAALGQQSQPPLQQSQQTPKSPPTNRPPDSPACDKTGTMVDTRKRRPSKALSWGAKTMLHAVPPDMRRQFEEKRQPAYKSEELSGRSSSRKSNIVMGMAALVLSATGPSIFSADSSSRSSRKSTKHRASRHSSRSHEPKH
ncbi:hypothetical protein QQS21_009868 [Conoideocrella luteorostrata]|uniref:Uncharacterized protein n=1 Tax=Conoideocrella luteorostrata TaxID=1105319 RepID=A0AAJ0FPY7_9HYPO|nr:hypothetical protein QQS21_009868 [Conoideocrella luteorostrata]